MPLNTRLRSFSSSSHRSCSSAPHFFGHRPNIFTHFFSRSNSMARRRWLFGSLSRGNCFSWMKPYLKVDGGSSEREIFIILFMFIAALTYCDAIISSSTYCDSVGCSLPLTCLCANKRRTRDPPRDRFRRQAPGLVHTLRISFPVLHSPALSANPCPLS